MTLYQLTKDASLVIRTSDGVSIPNDNKNVDYQAYQVWLSQGNTPDPYVPNPNDARIAAINSDATRLDLMTRLQNATATQINNYVDTNVVDLPSARTLLKKILLVLAG